MGAHYDLKHYGRDVYCSLRQYTKLFHSTLWEYRCPQAGEESNSFYCPTCLVSADWCGAFHKHQLFHASKSLAYSQLCVCSLVSSNHIHVDAAIITSYFTHVKAVFGSCGYFSFEKWIQRQMAQLVAPTNATGAKNKPSFAQSLQSSSKPESANVCTHKKPLNVDLLSKRSTRTLHLAAITTPQLGYCPFIFTSLPCD